MMKVINKATIQNRENFVLKWDDSPGNPEQLNPAWAEAANPDRFLDKIAAKTVIMDDSQVVDMKTLTYPLKYLDMEVDLELQRAREALGTASPEYPEGSSIPSKRVSIPAFDRKLLVAQPFIAKTKTSVNFLEENIEGKKFLSTIENKLAAQTGVSLESCYIYGTKDKLTPAEASKGATGYAAFDGTIQKLYNIQDEGEYVGVYDDPVDLNESIVTQLNKIILDYIIQEGDISNAVFYVPGVVKFAAQREISQRQTPVGDAFVTGDGNVIISGVPLKVAPVLNRPRNGFDQHGILTDKDNLAFGIMRKITSEQKYDPEDQEYTSVVTVKGDNGIIWDNKTIGTKIIPIGVTDNGSVHDVPITVKDNENNRIEDIEVKLSNNENEYTATTNNNGEATINDVIFGTYDVLIDFDQETYSDYTPKSKTVNKSSFRVDAVLQLK